MAELNTGKLTQIIGAVLDVRFSEGKLPEINDAIKVPLKDGEEDRKSTRLNSSHAR